MSNEVKCETSCEESKMSDMAMVEQEIENTKERLDLLKDQAENLFIMIQNGSKTQCEGDLSKPACMKAQIGTNRFEEMRITLKECNTDFIIPIKDILMNIKNMVKD